VLQVSHHGFQALLTGDIEKKIERQLVSEYAKQLKSELVLVPHHGSRSSSTRDFVTHVDPEWVINSSGYLNRYRFPADSVKLRWTQNNARFLDTATHGSIEFIIDAAGNLAGQRTFHDNQKKYWHENRLADRPG
jgi:competence protein ComEC